MAIPQNVIFSENADASLQQVLSQSNYDRIVVLVDENSRKFCLDKFPCLADTDIIQVSSGEREKTLATCNHIWEQMTQWGLSRKSALINLGGGVITDMGGFAASTYKRGIEFINIPTTLLSQVDASIGGKVGIDFNGLKNHLGVFREPRAVLLDTQFLATLDQRQLKSGFAEVIKHGLIADSSYWYRIVKQPFDEIANWNDLLKKSVELKGLVVQKDPLENGLRKILNFGHTLGHAIETYFLESEEPLLHGEAIAIGMILESKLSADILGMPTKQLEEISEYISSAFPTRVLPEPGEIEALLGQDKKNENNRVNYSLLEAIGKCQWNVQVSSDDLDRAMTYYTKFI